MRRNKIHDDRWKDRCDKLAAFYSVADEKFMLDAWTINDQTTTTTMTKRFRRRSSSARESAVGAPVRAPGLGSVKAHDRVTGVQLAIFNDRCSTIPRRSRKSAAAVAGKSKRWTELTNATSASPLDWMCGVRVRIQLCSWRPAYQCIAVSTARVA